MTQKHELKTLNIYWDAVAAGTKTFEVRRNDRAFQTGDILVLNRTDERGRMDPLPKDLCGAFPKSQIMFRISYLLQGGQFGIDPGHCVLGLAELGEGDDAAR